MRNIRLFLPKFETVASEKGARNITTSVNYLILEVKDKRNGKCKATPVTDREGP
jgi:hypothetical protein